MSGRAGDGLEQLTKSPKAVLLDFDGVVVDSRTHHLSAWDAATRAVFRTPLPSPEDLSGGGTQAIAGLLAARLGDRSLARALIAAKEAWLAAHHDQLPLLPGAREFIAALAAREIPHGIASNSPGAFVRGALAAAGLHVPEVVAGDEVPRGKPAPDIFWQLSNRLDVAPADRARVLVFEDSAHGLTAAARAGMVPLGVSTDYDEATLRAAGAVAVCANLGDALARGWLDSPPLSH